MYEQRSPRLSTRSRVQFVCSPCKCKCKISQVGISILAYTANLVPVMKTGIPCAHILRGKTCFNHKENLLSLQGTCFQNREIPIWDCSIPTGYFLMRSPHCISSIRPESDHDLCILQVNSMTISYQIKLSSSLKIVIIPLFVS